MLLAPSLEMTPRAFGISDPEECQTPGAMQFRRGGARVMGELTELDSAAPFSGESPALRGIFERASGVCTVAGPRPGSRNELHHLGREPVEVPFDRRESYPHGVRAPVSDALDQRREQESNKYGQLLVSRRECGEGLLVSKEPVRLSAPPSMIGESSNIPIVRCTASRSAKGGEHVGP